MSVVDLTDLRTEEPRRSRARLIPLLTIAAIAALIALLVAVQREQHLAQVRVRLDRVLVNVQGAGYTRAAEGQGLAAGDAVRTDERGEAQVDFYDGSLTRLDSDTTLVINELTDDPQGRQISLGMEGGRTWNRVERLRSSDRFELRSPNAVASVHGTTFIADGRQAPVWYYIGQLGTTQIAPPSNESFNLGPGDCVRVDPDGMRPCTDHELKTLLDDFVRENQVLDDALVKAIAPAGPTTAPSEESRVGTGSGSGGSGGSGAAPPTRRPTSTDPPNEADEPTDEPKVRKPPPPREPDRAGDSDDGDPPDTTDEPDETDEPPDDLEPPDP